MATNQVQRQSIPPQAFFDQQTFLIHGPVQEPHSQWQVLGKWWRNHPLGSALAIALCLILAEAWWAAFNYPGLAILQTWGCQMLAVFLLGLDVYLFFTFRRWEREREQKADARHERQAEINALLCTPPPLPATTQLQEEFAMTIEYWASDEPLRLTAESLAEAALPDEFLAPDTLVLSFEMRETVSPAQRRGGAQRLQ